MKRLFLLFLFVVAVGCQKSSEESSRTVVVSIAPLATFAEKIAGDQIEIVTLVPAGADPHSWSPTPRQIDRVNQADLWFRLGEIGEEQLLRAVKGRDLAILDVREGVELIYDPDHVCPHCQQHHSGADQHIWLSPRVAQTISQTMAAALIEHYPKLEDEIETGLEQWLLELRQLDREITAKVQGCKTILTSHAAYGYFARDYGLTQISIEVAGKEPTPQQLANMMRRAQASRARCIFVQPQTNQKGAERVAHQLGLKIRVADPLATDYAESLRQLAQDLSECCQ